MTPTEAIEALREYFRDTSNWRTSSALTALSVLEANILPLDKIPPVWSLKLLGESVGKDKYKCELSRPAVADGPVSAIGYGMTLETALLSAIGRIHE